VEQWRKNMDTLPHSTDIVAELISMVDETEDE
jgi:hypothetical protein